MEAVLSSTRESGTSGRIELSLPALMDICARPHVALPQPLRERVEALVDVMVRHLVEELFAVEAVGED